MKHPAHGFIIIRKSFVLLCFRILLVEVVYILLDYIFRFFLETPPNEFWFFALFGVKVLWVLTLLLQWYHDYYEVSHEKIEHYQGVLLKQSDLFPASYIEMIHVKQDIFGSLLGHGDIHMHSGQHNISFVLHAIPHPEHHMKLVEKIAPQTIAEKISA